MLLARAQGQCEGIVGEGAKRQRCEARVHLQFDHIRPIAAGGGGSVDNLQLLCSACNQRKLMSKLNQVNSQTFYGKVIEFESSRIGVP